MKKILFYLFFFSSLLVVAGNLMEDEMKEEEKIISPSIDSFFQNLTEKTPDSAEVKIFQEEEILWLMSEKEQKNMSFSSQNFIFLHGYRVQVYSRNTPRVARSEATDIELKMKEKYTDVNVYLSYTAPFWKVRVGDCKNYQEATLLMKKIKKDFPNIKDEIYIVKEDDIKIPY